MRIFVLLGLVSFSAQGALKFSMERSTPMGTDKIEVHEESGELVVKKTSNWFDRNSDTRLGVFRAKETGPLKNVAGEIAKVEKEIIQANERLLQVGRSFNELGSTREPHAPFFRVNGFRVQRGSVLYPRLEEIAERLQATPLVLVKGVELDKERKNYVFYDAGKEVKREPFNARFFCESSRFPTRCLAREWGALYLE